jgi:hypothetical protein
MKNRNSDVRGDRRAVESRRANAEGRPARHVPEWDWIESGKPAEMACLRMLRGESGLYPVFGIQLYVEEKMGGDEKFAALVYTDAKFGDEGQNLCGNLREGFWIGVKSLMGDPAKKNFKSPDHELLTLTLLGQPEMQVALSMFKEEERVARTSAIEGKKNLIAGLRNKVLGGNSSATSPAPAGSKKPAPPTLGSITEILTASWGTTDHDGLTILVCYGHGGRNAPLVVRLKNVPEDHPMRGVATKSIFVRQDSLQYADDLDPPTNEDSEVCRLAYALRTYLRGALMANGVILTQPVRAEGRPHKNGGAQLGNVLGAEASAAS